MTLLGVLGVPGSSLVGEDLKISKFQQYHICPHAKINPITNFQLFIPFIPEVISMWPFLGVLGVPGASLVGEDLKNSKFQQCH